MTQILSAPLQRHKLVKSRSELKTRLHELLETVGLTPPEEFLKKHPHQLSGGQRQRVSVARALTVDPEVIVADEPVSMVDVSLRIGLLNMLLGLQKELGVAFLFITHDLAVAKHFSWEGRIGVMYLGRMVELGPTQKARQGACASLYAGPDLGAARGGSRTDAQQREVAPAQP